MTEITQTTEIIDSLLKKYKDDEEAIKEIEQAKETVKYYLKQEQKQKAISHIKQLEAFLKDWY